MTTATVTIDPAKVPKHIMDMLSRAALQGLRKSLEDPEYRAKLEKRLIAKQENQETA